MSLIVDGGPVGLGFASVLIQANLGVGLVLTLIGTAVACVPAVGAQLKDLRWEATLRAVAAASAPVPLLSVFALLQASGAVPDFIAWLGLLVATAAVLSNIFLVALCSGLSSEVPAVTRTGEIITDAIDSKLFSTGIRVVSALRAFGQTLVVFAALPAGVQLFSASLLLRLALCVDTVSVLGRAMGLMQCDGIEMQSATLLASFALLDHLVWDAGSFALAIFQPTIWGAGVSLLLLGIHVMERDVKSQESSNAAPRFGPLCHFVTGGVHMALAASALRVVVGIFKLAMSMTSISVQWGEPVLAAAALLGAFVVAVCALEFVMDKAGVEGVAAALATGHVKAIVMPAQSLVLALIASHMSREQPPDSDSFAAVVSLFTAPLSIGLVMAGAAVVMQEVLLVSFILWSFDACSALEAPLDSTGTLNLPTKHKIVSHVRTWTLLLLQGGLSLGLLSLGNLGFWIGVVVVTGPLTLFLLPTEVHSALGGVLSVLLTAVCSSFGGLTSGMQAILKEREQAKLAQMAKQADAIAATVVAEEGDDAKGKRKSEAGLASAKTQAKAKTVAKKKR